MLMDQNVYFFTFNQLTSGVARAFLGGQATHLEDQNKEENEENFEEKWEKLRENEEHRLQFISLPPGRCEQ